MQLRNVTSRLLQIYKKPLRPLTAFLSWTPSSKAMAASSAAASASASASPQSRLVYGKDDVLFGCIEQMQGGRPWGSLLDAGTGLHSLRWIATLDGVTDFVAVTADDKMRNNCQREMDAINLEGRLVLGNWFSDNPAQDLMQILPQASFDVILADYLIGALDGFSPYRQDELIARLARLLKPQGRLYIVGLEPIPDSVNGPANVMCKVRQVRDACILLAGHRCYREYPLEWVQRQVRDYTPQLKLIDSSSFPILYRHATILKQIDVARSKFPLFANSALRESMKQVCNQLEEESYKATQKAANNKLQLGFDYVVVAEKVATPDTDMKSEL
jgi:SAM-dependent methyltransferase